ncbi:MAG: carbonic anhydrase [Actinobacteria bacterium]|nr:carbonic anhydrase [Actinomycetota bacterium]
MSFPESSFSDVLSANEKFAENFAFSGLTGQARRGLAVVTCMDSRIDPLGALGMKPGDAKIIRNAGARVTDDVLRTLVLAGYLLGVERVLVMPHTQCRMAGTTEAEIHATLASEFGVDSRSLEFLTVSDQRAALARDVQRIRSHPLAPSGMVVGGGVYHVETGVLEPVDA